MTVINSELPRGSIKKMRKKNYLKQIINVPRFMKKETC